MEMYRTFENGTKTCKNSPTIYEKDLHNAIIDSLKEVLPKSDDITKKVRDEIEAVIMKMMITIHKLSNVK